MREKLKQLLDEILEDEERYLFIHYCRPTLYLKVAVYRDRITDELIEVSFVGKNQDILVGIRVILT